MDSLVLAYHLAVFSFFICLFSNGIAQDNKRAAIILLLFCYLRGELEELAVIGRFSTR